MKENVFFELLTTAYLLFYLIVASYWDFKYKKIPNWLNFTSIILGIVLSGFSLGWSGIKESLWGFGLGIALFFIPFALGGVGAGDVKFLAGIGSLKGPDFVIWVFLITSLFYFMVSIVVMLKKGNLFSFMKKLYVTLSAKTNTLDTIYDNKGWNIPLGILISLAAIITYVGIFDGIGFFKKLYLEGKVYVLH